MSTSLVAPVLQLAASVGLAYWCARFFRRTRSLREWTPVEANLEDSMISDSYGRNGGSRLDIRYSYVVGGREYRGRSYYPGGLFAVPSPRFSNRRDAQRALAALGVSARGVMRVYVNPDDPSDSAARLDYSLSFPVGLAIVAVVLFVGATATILASLVPQG